jgi:threonine dehydrogenase-like Zn-dependent dehydrogenase
VVAESACIPIPDQVSFEDAVWFALAKIGFLGACVAEVKPGATVLVIGGGPIAQMLVRWLTISGAGIVGLLARDPVQLENGKSGGATVPIRAQTNEISLDKIEGALGKQPQTIFDCTDSVDVLSWALRVVADYGRVVLLGDPGTPNQRRLTSDVLLRSITVVGVHDRNVFGQWNEKTISQLFFKSLSTRHFSLSGLCTHVFKPVDAPRAYALIGNGATGVLGIRFDWTTLPELNLVN